MVGGKKSQHTVKANVKEFSKNALSSTNRAIQTTISNYAPFMSASLMNASMAAFDASRFAKENNPLTRNKNKDPYVRRAINRATDAFQTSLNELRQGHLSFEETRNEIAEYINENSDSEWDSMTASVDGETGDVGGGSQKQFSVSDYVKGVAASSKSNVRALQVTTNKITESQYKSLNLATSKIISSNMANMQAITRQFSVTNSRIENVNANLVNLVQFNNTTVSDYFATSISHMGKMETYLEEMVAYSRLENEKRKNQDKNVGAKYRAKRKGDDAKDFLAYGFDPSKYAKSIVDNLMETAFGPTVLSGIASGIKTIFGKVPDMLTEYAASSFGDFIQQINPIQLVVEKLMPSLKGFTKIDEMIQSTVVSFFSQLGSGTYNGPFSEIARIFGIRGSTANIDKGDYNHGEASWTGEDSRALKQVIPDYLSNIELNITNMVDQSIANTNAMIEAIKGIQSTILMTSNISFSENNIPKINNVGRSATNRSRRLYDFAAGDFTTESKIIDTLRTTLRRSTSMHYDDSKKVIKDILKYANSDKMSDATNKKALSDALTAIFMNFNAIDGETAITEDEFSDLISALQGLGIDTTSKEVTNLLGQFKTKTQKQRLTANRDVGQEFQRMRNLGIGASTNDKTTDIVNHNRDVIKYFKDVFTFDSILRTLDDELDNFANFKNSDEYRNMDRNTQRAYERSATERDRNRQRRNIIDSIFDPKAFENNPFNVVAGSVVDTTRSVVSSFDNVVTGVSTFGEEIRNITQTLKDAASNIKRYMVGGGAPDFSWINDDDNGNGPRPPQFNSGAIRIPEDQIVKVHKGELILDPELSERVRNGIVDFINGNMSESNFDNKIGNELTKSQLEDVKFIKQAMQSAGKIKIKDLDDVTEQIWNAAKYIDKAPSFGARLELLLRQIAYNQEVGLIADNVSAVGESNRDSDSMDADRRDRNRQALHRGIGKLNKDGLYEGGVLSDFANSVKGTYDKVINSLVGKAYNTYENIDGQKTLVHHGENQDAFLKRYKKWLVGRAEAVADALGMKGEHKENISKTFDFIGENGHKLVLGGLAGMVANCVLPVAIGPVLGVGAALVGSSKTLNEKLFGTKDEQTGLRDDNGLISAKVTNFVKENMFSLISGGILGMKVMKSGPVSKVLGAGANHLIDGIIGIIPGGGGLIGQVMQGAVGIAFGPVGGALLGMGVAAMTQSESVKKFLFGDKDNATGKRKGGILGTIKNSFENLGGALKEKIFGKDVEYTDENGNKVKRKDGSGILNRFESAVYAHVLRPITTSAKYIGQYFKLWFKDDILNASARVIYPIANGMDDLAEKIRGGIDNMLHKQAESIKTAFEPVTKAITSISSKLAKATLSGVESIIKLSLKSVSAPINILAALLGKTKLGKLPKDGKRFIGLSDIATKFTLTKENFRLLFDELGGGANQFINLRSTNKKGKGNGIIDKFEKFLDRTEGIFKGIRNVRDFFKGLENSPVISAITTPLKTVLNVFTHPVSVILKNVAEGVMDGFKALLTAPVKLLTAPFKGIKWIGNKLFGGESKLGTAISNFKERAAVIRSGGSVDPNASDLTKQFAKTTIALGKAATARANANGLITKNQQNIVDANNEHKRLKNDKKALEKQHKRDKALDNYIAKLNIQMSPAEFDALSADKRNDIIRKLVRKSGNKDIAHWDEEKIRALVTGGRGKVQQLEIKNQTEEKATKNVANLPDLLNNITTSIVNKMQEIYDVITGKTNQAQANGSGASKNGGTGNGRHSGNNKNAKNCYKLAGNLVNKLSSDPTFINLFPELSAVVGKPQNVVVGWLTATSKNNPTLYKDIELAVNRQSTSTVNTLLVANLTKIGQSKNDQQAKFKNADAVLDSSLQKLGVDPKTVDKKTMKKLRNIASALVNAPLGSANYKSIAQNLMTEIQKIGDDKASAWKQTKAFNAGIKSLGTKSVHKISSWFDASINDSSSNFQTDPTTGKMVSTTANGKYNWDDKAQRFVVADKVKDPATGKWVYTGSHNLTFMGRIKKAIRQGRDGTTDAINPDGSLNVNGMNPLQKLIARGMLGKGWEEKKSRGELDREKEQELTSKLKMLATGSGKVKLITDIIGKVIKGLFGVGTFLVGLGAFATYIYPMIKDPIHDLLFGKDGTSGLLSKVKEVLVGKGEGETVYQKSGLFGLIKVALVGNPELAEDPNATEFEKGGLFGMAKGVITKTLPKMLEKGKDLCENLVSLAGRAIKAGIDYFFEISEERKKAKDNNTGSAKALSTVFQAAERKERMDVTLKDGTVLNIVDDNGNINFENLKTSRVDSGYSMSENGEATTDDYKVKVALAQFGIPLEVWSATGNLNDYKIRQSGKYFALADKLSKKMALGLSSDQINKMKTLKTSDGKRVDGYLFIYIGDAREGWVSSQWSIYPAIWDNNLEVWRVSPTRCGFCSTGLEADGTYKDGFVFDSDISTENINSSDGTWSSYADMRQEAKSVYIKPEDVDISTNTKSEGSGRGSIGYGHFTQNDPRWAKLGYGKMRSGSMSTMANGGCGPTAMANAINNVYGRNVTNPLTIANYASKNGYSVDGGTSAGLFNRGAKGLGVNSSVISKSGSSIANQLRHGKNVIVAGRGGSAYTSAGHIMSVRGIDRGGNAIVDDPMRRKSRHIPMNKLTRGMTHAWSIGRGPGDVYYGTSPDGTNYATLRSFYDYLGSDKLVYRDTSTGNAVTINDAKTTANINDSSIIWGWAKRDKDACFIKSLASAVFNLYAKKKGLNAETVHSYISQLGNSPAQPHTLQKSGTYGAATSGNVDNSSTLVNSVYAALNAIGDPVDTNGLTVDEHRGNDGPAQKSTILGNLQLGKPVVIHTNKNTSEYLSSGYKAAVFGAGRPNHAVLLDGLVTASDGKKYVVIGDPGSAQASGGTFSNNAQIRLVDFDQLTDPLKSGKLNHLITLGDGTNVSLPEVTAPNPEAAMGASTNATVSTSDASSSNSDDTIGINTTDTSKSKFSSFTEWVSRLVQHAAKIGSALLSALFSGKSFKEVWAEMNPSNSSGGSGSAGGNGSYPGAYGQSASTPGSNPARDAAFEMIKMFENPLYQATINTNHIKEGLKYINYDSELYEDFSLSKWNHTYDMSSSYDNMTTYKDESGRFYGAKITSQFAADLLGMALYYIKTHTPMAIDGKFKKYCILVANLLSKTARVNKVYNQYKSNKIIFKDGDGLFMFVALCFEKLLLPDPKSADKCANLFTKAIYTYQEAGGKFWYETEGSVGFGSMSMMNEPDSVKTKKEEKQTIRKNAKRDMITAAKNAASAAYEYMHDNYLVMTVDEAKKILSGQQNQTAQVGEYTATSGGNSVPYTGEWVAPNNQPWIDDPVYLKNKNLISKFEKPDTNYASASSGISSTYIPGYFPSNYVHYQNVDFNKYGRQLVRDLRSFPTITVDQMNSAIQNYIGGSHPDSPLIGQGQAFIDASNITGLDPLYLLAHSWESTYGKAWIARNVGDIYGQSGNTIATNSNGSWKRNPNGGYVEGKYAYAVKDADGNVTPRASIIGGAEMISRWYTNRDGFPQNNLLAECASGHAYNGRSDYANIIAHELQRAETAAGFGIGENGGVNIHDAMMNTPTSDIYTRDDDIYMGDANHPMNVKMDTTPTTSRLDVIINLLGELLKGDNSLPPATSKATEAVAGYGEGKTKSSNNTIVVANQHKKVDKPNTNMKQDRLRNVYDRISKRALTYTH